MNYAIYIPARNVGHVLESVIERFPEEVRNGARKIIIVDNASSDGTHELAIRLAQKYPTISIIRHDHNVGYGGSQKSAYYYCMQQKIDHVIMVHGDGQYAPELAGELLSKLANGSAAMVFGSRMTGSPLKGGMPLYRFAGNIILTKILNFLLTTNLSEFHSGYRAYKVEALAKTKLQECSDDYHFDTDIIIQLMNQGYSFDEVTIPTHYGKESRSISFLHSLWYAANILKAAVRHRVTYIRK